MSMIKANASIGDWCLLLLLSVLFGSAFVMVGIVLPEISPLSLVAYRVGIAALALWLIASLLGSRLPRTRSAWAAFAIMGLLNSVVPFLLIAWGQTRIQAGSAAILNATAPLFTVVIAGLTLADERATIAKLIGVLIGFFGVFVLSGFPSLDVDGDGLAQLAVLGAAVSYACAGVYGRRFRSMSIKPIVVAVGQLVASTVILFPLALAVDGVPTLALISTSVWFAVLGLGLLSTAAANVLYFKLLDSIGATNLLLVALLIPVSALILGWLWLNEVVELLYVIAMTIIAIGLSVIDGRIWRKVRSSLRVQF